MFNIEALWLSCIDLWGQSFMTDIEALWLSCIDLWGQSFMTESSVFSIMVGWIAEILFMLFFAYTAV